MTEEELDAVFAGRRHPDEQVRRQAEELWEKIREKTGQIEAEARAQESVIPAGARTEQQLLDEMLQALRGEEEEKAAWDGRRKA